MDIKHLPQQLAHCKCLALIEKKEGRKNNKIKEIIIIALILKRVGYYDGSRQIFRCPCRFPSFLCS